MGIIHRISRFFCKKSKKEFLIIFIGDLSTQVLNTLYPKCKDIADFLAISTDLTHLQKCVEIDQENKIFIGDQTKHSCGKRDFESGIIYVEENLRILEKKIKSFSAKRIILVAGLRYSSASGIIAGVSVITKKLKLHVTAVVSTPFEAEGQNAIVNSSKAINALNQNVDKLIDFSCEDLMQQNGGKLLIKDMDGKFEKEIFEALQLPRESKVHTKIIRKSYGK